MAKFIKEVFVKRKERSPFCIKPQKMWLRGPQRFLPHVRINYTTLISSSFSGCSEAAVHSEPFKPPFLMIRM